MDTMKIFLGATIALLLGALIVSWSDLKKDEKNAPAAQIAELKRQIKEMQEQQEAQNYQRQLEQLKATKPALPTPDANAAEIAALKAQIEEQKSDSAADKAKRDKQLQIDEEGLIAQRSLENKDKELREARMIADALLIGRVKEYVEDAQFGSFITFEVLMPEQVKPGEILSIRRNRTGMIGQFRVSEVTAEGAVANPLPGFGPANPKPGDELIFPPPF